MKGVSPSFLQKPEGVTWGDPWCSRVKGLHMFLFWPGSETKPELFLVLFLAIFERPLNDPYNFESTRGLPKIHFWKRRGSQNSVYVVHLLMSNSPNIAISALKQDFHD